MTSPTTPPPPPQPSGARAVPRVRATWRARVAVFVGALGAVLVALGLTGVRVARWVNAVVEEAAVSRAQAFRTAYELKTGLVRLALLLGRYQQSGDEAAREEFLRGSEALRRWLETQRSGMPPAARERLEELAAGFEQGLAQVRALVQAGNLPALSADLQARAFGAGDAAPRMSLTDQRFTTTQRLVAERELATLQSGLDWLRTWSVASTLLIVVLVAWLAYFLWRDLVAPLRAQVLADATTIRRQTKLSTVGRFAAGIAHEIRNPLNSIKARLYAQDRLLPPESPAREDNRVISDEVVRLEQIVRDFLAYSRPGEPRLQVISAAEPLRSVADLMGSELAQAGIGLELEVQVEPRVRADPAQLQQVLTNLVRNARESMPAGGRITLRCRRREAARTKPAAAVLEVQDSGGGIPPEVRSRLFEPFYTTKETGSGLGLSISAQIIEAHGGQIECETQLNVGTTFRILLPITTDHADAAEPSADS